MSYLVNIDETQRAIIEKALAFHLMNCDSRELSADEREEAHVLHSMFQTLPHDEAEMVTRHGHAPGTSVHGFCV